MKKGLLPIVVLATLGITAGTLTACSEPGDVTSSVSYPAITKLTISNKDALMGEWHVGEATKTVSFTTEPEINITSALQNGALKITSSNKEVVNVVGKVLYAVKEGTAKITATYDGKVSDSVDITVLPKRAALPIKNVIEGLNAGTIKKGTTLSTYGQITSTMLQIDGQIHNGVYIQDGEYALPLYAGKITENFFENKVKKLDIGDNVYIEGTVDIYNGFRQVKPSVMRKLTTEDKFTVAKPSMLTLTAETYNEDTLKSQMGRLVKFENLEYVSGGIADPGARDDIMFKAGTVDVKVSYNYHVGAEAGAALKAKTDTLAPTNKVDIIGSIYWFNGPAIQPVFYKEGDVLKTPADGFTVHPQPAITGLTIKGDKTVKATETIQLTVTAAPEGASPAVTWTSADEKIAKVSESGEVLGVKPGTVKITATSKANDKVKAEYTIEVTPAPVKNGAYLLNEAKAGIYKLGTFDGRDGVKKNVYLTGELKDNAFSTTADYKAAANVTVDAVEGGYTLKIGDKFIGGEEKDFPKKDGGTYKKSVPTLQDAAFTWSWNETYETFSYTTGTGDSAMEFVLSMKNNLDADKSIIELNKVNSYTAVNFNLKLADFACNPLAVDMTKAPVGKFLLGFTLKDGSTAYLTGKPDGYDLGMTTNFYAAAEATIAEVEGGYTIKVGEQYLAFNTYKSYGETKAGVKYQKDAYVLSFKDSVFYKTLQVGKTPADKDYTFGQYEQKFAVKAVSKLDRSVPTLTAYSIPETAARPTADALVITGKSSVMINNSIVLTSTVYPSGANPTCTWTTSDDKVATVANGIVTGVALGKATITAKAGEITKSVEITVTEDVSIKATLNTTEVPAGLTVEEDTSNDAHNHYALFQNTPVKFGGTDGQDITMQNDKADGSTDTRFYTTKDGTLLRMYSKNETTFTAKEGFVITNITFKCDKNKFVATGTTITDIDGGVSIALNTPANSIMLGVTATVKVTSIIVTYMPIA